MVSKFNDASSIKFKKIFDINVIKKLYGVIINGWSLLIQSLKACKKSPTLFNIEQKATLINYYRIPFETWPTLYSVLFLDQHIFNEPFVEIMQNLQNIKVFAYRAWFLCDFEESTESQQGLY